MNYLGHIYLSNDDHNLAVANLFGDFVKGNQYLSYGERTQQGILLHRQIDHYIDTHPLVKELVQVLRPDLPRVAPIAIDLYFDHLLAKNWEQFHTQDLPDFLDQFYRQIDLKQENYPTSFQVFIETLIDRNWLSYYPQEEGLYRMCLGVSRKISFENALSDGFDVFKKHEAKITEIFQLFMLDVQQFFLHKE